MKYIVYGKTSRLTFTVSRLFVRTDEKRSVKEMFSLNYNLNSLWSDKFLRKLYVIIFRS